MSPNPPSRDRRQILLTGDVPPGGVLLNGIDYVDVAQDQIHLFVHFLNTVEVKGHLTGTAPVTITGGEVVPTIGVDPIDEAHDWLADSEGRPVLALTAVASGDFSFYTLSLASTALDPFFSTALFSFKANCPSTLDCAPVTPPCPEPDTEPVPIDYLAKDFGSFRQALSEFSAFRYPNWVERSEADLGMVLLEAFSAMADELSYYQDRVAAESTLATATQRLSVIRHARLVDYEPAPATIAQTLLCLTAASTGTLHTALLCRALGADGAMIPFEVGSGLLDPQTNQVAPISFPIDTRWNASNLPPYWWDDSTRCLLAGSTSFYIAQQDLGLYPGQQLLLDTPAADSADPPVREVVVVDQVSQLLDPVENQKLTLVQLQAPTTEDHDLWTTVVAGNLVPATQGQRTTEYFAIPGGSPVATPTPPAVALDRVGANWTPEDALHDCRYCLSQAPLAWIASPVQEEDTTVPAVPELVMAEVTDAVGDTDPWLYQRWLLVDSASPLKIFTLTPEQYSPVLSIPPTPTSPGRLCYDYDGDGGTTVRFGNGTFGVDPDPGTVFEVQYRVGGGSVGNVPAGTITNLAPDQAQLSLVSGVTNPFAAAGGADAETIQQVRDRAPQAFAANPLRVVRPDDYVAAAQSLPWVQQAGTTFRWTGSWLTVFTSADPVGTEEPTIDELETLTELLNRRRLAGYESYLEPPRYVSIDLQIVVCGMPSYFGGDVQAAVLAALRPGALPSGGVGFFDHSRWGFGQPLESSALLAAVQACNGVDGVYSVQYRERGVQLTWAELPDTLTFASDQILRVDNDPSRPEAGSLQVTVEGSK